MDTSLFVASPVYLLFGLGIVALVVREVLRTRLATRRRHHKHHRDHHHHAA
jgi:hypothetical protein